METLVPTSAFQNQTQPPLSVECILLVCAMLKRPLNKRFSGAVREGRKTTTIRNTPWPVGVPIMLYNWSASPYRSPQHDVAAVVVAKTSPISIEHLPSGQLLYTYDGFREGDALWWTEGFEDGRDIERLTLQRRGLRLRPERVRCGRAAAGRVVAEAPADVPGAERDEGDGRDATSAPHPARCSMCGSRSRRDDVRRHGRRWQLDRPGGRCDRRGQRRCSWWSRRKLGWATAS